MALLLAWPYILESNESTTSIVVSGVEGSAVAPAVLSVAGEFISRPG